MIEKRLLRLKRSRRQNILNNVQTMVNSYKKKKIKSDAMYIWQFDVPTSGWLLHSKWYAAWLHFVIFFSHLPRFNLQTERVCVCVRVSLAYSVNVWRGNQIVHNLSQLNMTDTLNYDFYIDQFNAQIKRRLITCSRSHDRKVQDTRCVYVCVYFSEA